MAVFKRIMCPVDFEPDSTAALELARDLARQNRASLFLFHVVPMPAEGPERGVIYHEREAEALKRLARLARSKLGTRVRHQIRVVTGRPDRSVLNGIRNAKADLVVMGTRGRKGLSRLLLGSVAGLVAREAPCPVLIVRPRTRGRAAAGR